jgi:Cu2+-exporting ATPase
MRKVYEFLVPDVTCSNCFIPIVNQLHAAATLKKHDSKAKVTTVTDPLEKRIVVTVTDSSLSKEKIQAILKAEISEYLECEIVAATQTTAAKKRRRLSHLLKGIAGILCGGAMMTFCLTGGMAMIPAVAVYILSGVCSAIIFYLGFDTYRDAFKKLFKNRAFTMDALFTISTLTAIGVSIASLFVPGLPMMFDAALFIFGFRHIGKTIEETIKQKVMSGLTFQKRAPKKIIKIVGTEEIEVDVASLKIGDMIKILPGQIIPVNGNCQDKTASVYDTLKTGENLPQRILADAALLAGMQVAAGTNPLTLKVTATANASYLAKLDKDIHEARLNYEKAPLELSAERYLQYFNYALLALAITASVAVYFLFSALSLAITVGALISVSACPCTLGFITPLLIKIGFAKAAEQGIHFKNGKSLQSAGETDMVFLDLNGTLTTGEYNVTDFTLLPAANEENISKREALAIMEALEANSEHPIAIALKKYAATHASTNKLTVPLIDDSHHCGIRANIKGNVYTIGNKKMLAANQITLPKKAAIEAENPLDQVIYLAKNNKIIGQFILQTPLRHDAVWMIQQLRALGKKLGRKIRIRMITGTHEIIAKAYGSKAGIKAKHVIANCTNEDKAKHLQTAKQNGHRPIIIGDGGNDSLSMASFFGIAIKSKVSDSMTEDSAGVVIADSSLAPIITTLTIAAKTVANIKKSLVTSFVYNSTALLATTSILIAMRLAATPLMVSSLTLALNPAVGVVIMIVQTTLILLMAYRFFKQKTAAATSPPNPEASFNTTGVTQKLASENTLTAKKNLLPLQVAAVTTIANPNWSTPKLTGTSFQVFTNEASQPTASEPFSSEERNQSETTYYC